MSEETKDPRDLNGDGKVSFGERVQYAADKANEKISEVADEMKENAKEMYEKASPKVKEAYEEAKENAGEWMDKAKAKIKDIGKKKED